MTSIPWVAAAATSSTLVDPVSTVTISVTPSPDRRLHRRHREPVPLVDARRDVRDRVDAQSPERDHQLGEPGQAVRVEVAEHHHPFARPDRASDPIDHAIRVGQQPWVVEAVLGGAQEAGDRARRRRSRGARAPSSRTCPGRAHGPRPGPPGRGAAVPGRPSGDARRSSSRGCHVRLIPDSTERRDGAGAGARIEPREGDRVPAAAGSRDHVAGRRLGRAASSAARRRSSRACHTTSSGAALKIEL